MITGDIAGHGEERDFRSVRRILKYFGLLEYEKLTVQSATMISSEGFTVQKTCFRLESIAGL